MKITLIAVGKIREKWIRAGMDEYAKRLSRFVSLNIVEVPDEPEGRGHAPPPDREGQRILAKLPESGTVCALSPSGRQLGSEGLADLMERQTLNGTSHFIFIIGGSRGLSPAVLEKAHFCLSLGSHTFPHQLFRVMLLEQLYRAEKIRAGETYHK